MTPGQQFRAGAVLGLIFGWCVGMVFAAGAVVVAF
jgi:hypothetical protein